MRKWLRVGLAIFAFSLVLSAQSRESATRSGSSLRAGVEFSMFNPDFFCASSSPFSCGSNGHPLIKGIAGFGDYDHGRFLGIEAEGRWLRWDNIKGQRESTYLFGPRVRLVRLGPVLATGKFMMGAGKMEITELPSRYKVGGTTLVYGPGVTADYTLRGRLSVRADYEFQVWPSFSVSVDGAPHDFAVTPNGFSFGISYKLM